MRLQCGEQTTLNAFETLYGQPANKDYQTDCANSKTCAPFKHHFDECVERVTRAQEDGDSSGPHEDCVEECKHATTNCSLRYVINELFIVLEDNSFADIISLYSLPPPALRHPMCCPQALEELAVNRQSLIVLR